MPRKISKRNAKNYIKLPPPAELILSMRSLGYALHDALADIIDNSIAADARKICVDFVDGPNPFVVVHDDGRGMTETELRTAMTHGGKGPGAKRDPSDLGRFGLGLKTASMSQCKVLTVVTWRGGKACGLRWDLDHVAESSTFEVEKLDDGQIDAVLESVKVQRGARGTVVLWTNLDRTMAHYGRTSWMKHAVEEVRPQLSLVFHRMKPRVVIELNGTELDDIDPFVGAERRGSTDRPVKSSAGVKVEGFFLKKDMKPSDVKRLGITSDLRASQGIFVYRNQRLVRWGGWHGLAKKDEMTKFARVRLELSTATDDEFELDIRKTSLRFPETIKKWLNKFIENEVKASKERVTRRAALGKEESKVWRSRVIGDAVAYEPNADYPRLKEFHGGLDSDRRSEFLRILYLLGSSLPFESIYADFAQSTLVVDSLDSNVHKEIRKKLLELEWDPKNYVSEIESSVALSERRSTCLAKVASDGRNAK